MSPGEQLLHLGAGQKHQQQQAKPVDKGQDVAAVFDGVDDVLHEWQASQQCRPQHDAGQNLSHYLGQGSGVVD
ncbi:hypothetical protein A3649_04290 [Mycobacterium ulcerans]|nr:hypothetical protein A3649_04290 [Mycobacterium ulcerans]